MPIQTASLEHFVSDLHLQIPKHCAKTKTYVYLLMYTHIGKVHASLKLYIVSVIYTYGLITESVSHSDLA